MRCIPKQKWIGYGSVKSRPLSPPPTPHGPRAFAFFFFFLEKLQMAHGTWGRALIQKSHLKIGYKYPTLGQQIAFLENKLKIPCLREIRNNLIKLVREEPNANRS